MCAAWPLPCHLLPSCHCHAVVATPPPDLPPPTCFPLIGLQRWYHNMACMCVSVCASDVLGRCVYTAFKARRCLLHSTSTARGPPSSTDDVHHTSCMLLSNRASQLLALSISQTDSCPHQHVTKVCSNLVISPPVAAGRIFCHDLINLPPSRLALASWWTDTDLCKLHLISRYCCLVVAFLSVSATAPVSVCVSGSSLSLAWNRTTNSSSGTSTACD